MLESYIFSDIIKIDTRLLFQKTRAKEKIIFSYADILEKIRQKETIQSLFNTISFNIVYSSSLFSTTLYSLSTIKPEPLIVR